MHNLGQECTLKNKNTKIMNYLKIKCWFNDMWKRYSLQNGIKLFFDFDTKHFHVFTLVFKRPTDLTVRHIFCNFVRFIVNSSQAQYCPHRSLSLLFIRSFSNGLLLFGTLLWNERVSKLFFFSMRDRPTWNVKFPSLAYLAQFSSFFRIFSCTFVATRSQTSS